MECPLLLLCWHEQLELGPRSPPLALNCINNNWEGSSDLSACHSISLSVEWWVICFLIMFHSALGALFSIIFSMTVLSVKPSSLFTFFLPSFSEPPLSLLWEAGFSTADWVCQSDIASLIATVLLKDTDCKGCMPKSEEEVWICITDSRPSLQL